VARVFRGDASVNKALRLVLQLMQVAQGPAARPAPAWRSEGGSDGGRRDEKRSDTRADKRADGRAESSAEINERRRAKGAELSRADVRRAIMTGAVERVRPKMMTVVAIMAGLLPILWSTGTGSEVMRRIAVPMVGGMVSSTVLTLLVIPAIYMIVKGWRLPEQSAEPVALRGRSTSPAE